MDSISIPATFTVESLDSCLHELHSNPSAALNIPCSLQFKGMISSSSYLQFILTWAKLSSNKSITFFVRSETEIPFIAKNAETFIALLSSSSAKAFDLSTGNTHDLELGELKRDGLNLFAQLQGGKPVQQNLFGADEVDVDTLPRKGARIHLLAADAYVDHAFPNWFYRGPPERRKIREPDDFISLVRSVTTLLHQRSNRHFGKWVENLSHSFGEMLYELVDNTHNWGKYGINQELITSVRGATFDLRFEYARSNVRLYDISVDIEKIREFILFHQTEAGEYPLGFMEITVFDGGIGLPSRELHLQGITSPTISQEFEATITCFNKWTTSSKTQGRGLGLSKVIEITSKKRGYIYLRTGSLSLSRDFANFPATDEPQNLHSSSLLFSDAATGASNPTKHPVAAGTFLTIVLPFTPLPPP